MGCGGVNGSMHAGEWSGFRMHEVGLADCVDDAGGMHAGGCGVCILDVGRMRCMRQAGGNVQVHAAGWTGGCMHGAERQVHASGWTGGGMHGAERIGCMCWNGWNGQVCVAGMTGGCMHAGERTDGLHAAGRDGRTCWIGWVGGLLCWGITGLLEDAVDEQYQGTRVLCGLGGLGSAHLWHMCVPG